MRRRDPRSGAGHMSVDLIRAPMILLAVVALGGCGTSSPPETGGSALGQTILTASTTTPPRSTSTATNTGRPTTTASPPESIRLPAPPPTATPHARAIVRVARRFAGAYLLYQSGRDPRPVERAIAETCTRAFARLLLSQPVNIPAAQRSLADPPSVLGSVTYTGPASLGPGPPVQVVIARYHAMGHANAEGQLTIELTASGRGWRVSSLR